MGTSKSRGIAGASGDERARQARAKAARLIAFADQVERGSEGERRVAQQLRQLGPDFAVLSDLDDPGRRSANIDLVVIGPTGVFVIDAKMWKGRLDDRDGRLHYLGRSLIRESTTVREQATRIAVLAGTHVSAVLCFVETALPKSQSVSDGVNICSLVALPRVITRQPPVLGDSIERARIEGVLQRLVRSAPTAAAGNSSIPEERMIQATADAWPSQRRPHVRPRRTGRPKDRVLLPLLIAAGFMVIGVVILRGASRYMTRGFNDLTERSTTPLTVGGSQSIVVSDTTDLTATTEFVASSAAGMPVVPYTAIADIAEPTVTFSCSSPGAGWAATPAPTEFIRDEVGFSMWYQSSLDSSQWIYWGEFRSGIGGPTPIGVEPGATLAVKIVRGSTFDSSTDQSVGAFTAPTESC